VATKYVYCFGGGKADGKSELRDLLGGKGANLAEMTNIQIPVPAGFTISTDVCTHFYQNEGKYPESLEREVEEALEKIEKAMGMKLGDAKNPLLLSIRSGARVSMPGMMDTVLNLGLNRETVEGLASKSGDDRFAFDCYRRFVQMYGDVVLGLGPEAKDDIDPFEEILAAKKNEVGAEKDIDLGVDELKDLVDRYKAMIRDRTGVEFPDDPNEQLWNAIGAVFSAISGTIPAPASLSPGIPRPVRTHFTAST
jgi:pyruvate,orthophosphate dikinase